jgi:molybdopterin molybdotransferase
MIELWCSTEIQHRILDQLGTRTISYIRKPKQERMFADHLSLGLDQALQMTLSRVSHMNVENVPLSQCADRIAASALHAIVDSPSIDASLKDGYALLSKDIEHASQSSPVSLKVTGSAAAGAEGRLAVVSGTAVRILSGAKIPDCADAVLSEEFARPCEHQGWIEALHFAEPGRNILPKGTDVRAGQKIVQQGDVLTPGLVGFLASAGHSIVPVFQKPAVSILATGDEVVIPGRPLPEGKLYASNLATLDAWCKRYNFISRIMVVEDNSDRISTELRKAADESDVIITSGGAWTGDRDMVVKMLQGLGWEEVFHRIRIGPGKAVGFGLLRHKPVFVLPGGPPSNLTAFLQIALPGLLKLSGRNQVGLPTTAVRLAQSIRGRSVDWTQFIFGRIEHHLSEDLFHPLLETSRLQSMAEAEAVVSIPEGQTLIDQGQRVRAQLLN